MSGVEIAAAVSSCERSGDALDEALAGIGRSDPPDLCCAFASGSHAAEMEEALARIHSELAPRAVIGCGAAGVLAQAREVESGAGLALWAAWLDGAAVSVTHIADADAEPPQLNGAGHDRAAGILIADPYSFRTDLLVERLNEEQPGRPLVGGLASASIGGTGRLLCNDEVHAEGAVLCAISGVDVLPLVSQGATPVGPELAITACEGNLITELAFQPALERIGEAVGELDPDDRANASAGLLVGIAIDHGSPEPERGDFLVRPIVGAERSTGAVAVGEGVRVGQMIRLHVRGADSADADLRDALEAQRGALGAAGAAGALLFTCNGRGSNMFVDPDHDALALDLALDAPSAGFFCAGEIGPVGGRNFQHGFTATAAVIAAER